MSVSSEAFPAPEPPAPQPAEPVRPARRRRRILAGILAVVLLAGLGAGAWWAVTTYRDLGDTRDELAAARNDVAALQGQSSQQDAQIVELEGQSARLQSNLEGRTAELADLTAEHTRLDTEHQQLVADHTALDTAHTSLHRSVDSIALDLNEMRDIAEALAAYMMPMGSSVDPRLTDTVRAVRDDLAALIGWFDTAEEYNTDAFMAFFTLSAAIEDIGDEELSQSFQDFLEAHRGSQAEVNAWAGFVSRFFIIVLNTVDQAMEEAKAAAG